MVVPLAHTPARAATRCRLLLLRSVNRATFHATRQAYSRCHAQQESRAGGAPELETTPAFAAKLLLGSIGGAAALKYGSLLLDVPFSADPKVASALVVLPCVLTAVLLWVSGAKAK